MKRYGHAVVRLQIGPSFVEVVMEALGIHRPILSASVLLEGTEKISLSEVVLRVMDGDRVAVETKLDFVRGLLGFGVRIVNITATPSAREDRGLRLCMPM